MSIPEKHLRKSSTAVVVGNGLSLLPEELDFIDQQDWLSIGVNRIYKIYDQTRWRPDVVFFADFMRNNPKALAEDIRIHRKVGDYPLWVRGDLGRNIPHDLLAQCIPFFDCSHSICGHGWHPADIRDPNGGYATEEWHLPELCKAGGTTFIAMQWAVREGYERIILVGMDGRYTGDETKNHFAPDYLPPEVDRTPEQARADTTNQTHAHEVAARECKVRGVEVHNASSFSFLHMYETPDLAQLGEI